MGSGIFQMGPKRNESDNSFLVKSNSFERQADGTRSDRPYSRRGDLCRADRMQRNGRESTNKAANRKRRPFKRGAREKTKRAGESMALRPRITRCGGGSGNEALARIEIYGSRRQRQLHVLTGLGSRFDLYADIKSQTRSAVEKAQRTNVGMARAPVTAVGSSGGCRRARVVVGEKSREMEKRAESNKKYGRDRSRRGRGENDRGGESEITSKEKKEESRETGREKKRLRRWWR